MRIHNTFLRAAVPIACLVYAASAVSDTGVRSLNAHSDEAMQAASSVSADSLEAMIRFLSVEPATGTLRNRFVLREADLAVVADSLAQRLARYTGLPVDRAEFAVSDDYYDPGVFAAENIMVRVPGISAEPSVVIICAHYDAIGIRTGEWWRESWDADTTFAPGADDNGTGVAALMEAARVLPGYGLPFDLLFVLFSAEELGKLGSIDFTGRCDSACTEEILGVLNLDMIGYNGDGTAAGSILTDYSSAWMAEMLAGAVSVLDPDLAMRIVKPAPSNWDHAPFWEHTLNGQPRHIPAVTLAEPLLGGGSVLNPHYHTEGDTIGWIDLEQTERITRALVGFVAGFADRPAEVALMDSDVLLRGERTHLGAGTFPVGETITASVRCRNLGGQSPPAQTVITLGVTLENAGGVRTLYSGPVQAPGPLRAAETAIRFVVASRDAGENRLWARISVSGFDDGDGNNETEVRFVVEGEGDDVLAACHFRPNPIVALFPDAEFCVNLSAEANIILDILTIEGERISTAYIGAGYGRPVGIGSTCFPCRELFPGISNLASGIYLYRLKVFDAAGGIYHRAEKFAVLN